MLDRAVPRIEICRQDWQRKLAEAVTDPAELCRILNLPETLAAEARRAAQGFGLLVPRPYLERIELGNQHDPLLRQVLPIGAETAPADGFHRDPLCEAAASTAPGLLSKYRGRSLIVATGRCGVHCRFCFRRHYPAPPATGTAKRETMLRQLAQDPSVHEVILSGGDPLILDDETLGQLAERLADMEHVRRLRVHTRMPVVIPSRVTDALLGILRGRRLAAVVVVHVNHPAEIDATVARAFGRFVDAGIPVLSQTVLLRGVNDGLETLAGLFERLVDLRVMPYYLHQLDRVVGAAHFEVPEKLGILLISELRARLPGYAVPRYVRDLPGNPGKSVLA